MHNDRNNSECMPPGTHAEMVSDPSGDAEREIELAIFQDHRVSFFYWLKWTRGMLGNDSAEQPPALVTIDWHRDLAPPNATERNKLDSLDQDDLSEINRFVSRELDYHNDGHVLSAAWLNLIGDIYLLKNYGMAQSETYTDREGTEHDILEFRNTESLYSTLSELNGGSPVYFDIDIDFFVNSKVRPYQRTDVELQSDREVEALIDPGSNLFRYLFGLIAGMTIATEPRYCGGVRNSKHILEVILNRLFTENLEWKHLI